MYVTANVTIAVTMTDTNRVTTDPIAAAAPLDNELESNYVNILLCTYILCINVHTYTYVCM